VSDEHALETLQRRLERERRARRDAEMIAERVTAELYGSKGELQRANEELQSLNQSLREFVAIASHDIRNPLTTILGMSSTLTRRWESVPDGTRAHFLEAIERQAKFLARIVEDLLTVSRIDAGALDTHAEAFRLRTAVENAIAGFERDAETIRILVDDTEIVADPDHLQRILYNYVGNALKYGAPPVEITTQTEDGFVEIRVRDHGSGVPDDLVPRLFGKFARGDAARSMGGTGLGLSIVQGLARANGGDTWYEPNTPCGSCFGVKLPAA
jgi:signal transduction histidine kinase